MAKTKAKIRRVQLTETIWDLVAEQAKRVNSTESKVANLIIAAAFDDGQFPIKKGTVLP